MRYTFVFFLFCFISTLNLNGQTRTITGKVIGAEPGEGIGVYDDFFIVENAIVLSSDSNELGRTDEQGFFKIQLTDQSNEISVGWVGMEWERVEIKEDCNHLEIILIPDTIYDFISARKVERLRRKEREALSGLYDMAYELGVFENEKPCR